MIDWLIRRRLAAFEATWNYSMDYARQLLAGSRRAFWGYARLAPLAQYREGVPSAAWHVAKIVALRGEDCGPCTQLAVDMARAEGVPDALLLAALADDSETLQRLDADAALTHAFALAWSSRDGELPLHRDAVQRRFGDTGLASLALAMSVSRVFPMIKSALGHGQACTQISIGERLAALSKGLAPESSVPAAEPGLARATVHATLHTPLHLPVHSPPVHAQGHAPVHGRVHAPVDTPAHRPILPGEPSTIG